MRFSLSGLLKWILHFQTLHDHLPRSKLNFGLRQGLQPAAPEAMNGIYLAGVAKRKGAKA